MGSSFWKGTKTALVVLTDGPSRFVSVLLERLRRCSFPLGSSGVDEEEATELLSIQPPLLTPQVIIACIISVVGGF